MESLAASLTDRFPFMADAQVLRGWAGLREMTPDDRALVGPVGGGTGLWVAAGFSGHGFMQAPAVGRTVAAWLIDGTPDLGLSALDPARFQRGVAIPQPETAIF